jgi:hypothetical protein
MGVARRGGDMRWMGDEMQSKGGAKWRDDMRWMGVARCRVAGRRYAEAWRCSALAERGEDELSKGEAGR